ncbi:hypothetical protein [Paenibacillus xylanexedens]|uniref:Amidophosphoribosyltransferase n=1 Tax=Paenibacillus xylanexedens TaxID=528191 RepID=A0ABS4RWH7_PAEXY|nr:hypothetical protein [Paenibacillus xylanexedens]MBP2247220.1 putative amidophosphoribosyltransferase [Paenibacillus xylanexedens]
MFVERRNEFRNVFEQMLHQQEADATPYLAAAQYQHSRLGLEWYNVLVPRLSIEKAAHRRPFEQEYDFQFEV